MLPIKINQGLTLPDDTLLVKVPDDLYQKWWELALHWAEYGTPVAERQENLLALLCEWLRNDYPEYSMIGFEDLDKEEAEQKSKQYNISITWGMYVLLQLGGSMQPVSLTDKLLGL